MDKETWLTGKHVYENVLRTQVNIVDIGGGASLTMLKTFQAMKRVKDHPILPQSDCTNEESEFVHLGYEMALDAVSKVAVKCYSNSLVVHVLIPLLAVITGKPQTKT
jgi:hypothetical protein